MKFNDFALRPEILQAVAEAGYEIPTPIQQQAIPIILTGSDLLGIARDRGWTGVSLETGSMDSFAPARALYEGLGLEEVARYHYRVRETP